MDKDRGAGGRGGKEEMGGDREGAGGEKGEAVADAFLGKAVERAESRERL
jgi:hypothetical protein